MSKRKIECGAEEWDRQKAMSRERNARYLAKNDPEVKAKRAAASKAYLERLKTDPAYAGSAADRSRKAVRRSAAWQAAHPEKSKRLAKELRQRYPEREVARVQRRNAAKIRAIPAWADMAAIARHYLNARYLTEVTGCQHHVDHIIPLRGKTVCGLHVENNLRAVPHYLNARKGNKLIGV